ncbi:MAG: hypothetical protein ACJAQ3_003608 [Planctomycetota bacterium]
MTFQGTPTVTANDLVLRASSLPPGALVLFLGSRSSGWVPAGGGRICVGGEIGRFLGPGEVQMASAIGQAQLVLDLTSLPNPVMGTISAQASDVWRFQAWHRDSVIGIPTSNVTNALAIQLQ